MEDNLLSATRKLAWFCSLLALGASGARFAAAQPTIDVSLNLDYLNNADADSGGTWELAVKASDQGLAGLAIYLQDINLPTEAGVLTPRGTVNDGDFAGIFGDYALGDSEDWQFVASFSPLTSGELGVFYGVGSIVDPEGGSPNYPDQDPDTTSIGPVYTTLGDLENVPWGTGDFFNDPAWEHAAVLFTGTFAPGQTPSFFVDNDEGKITAGRVFTSVPTMPDQLGTLSDEIVATTIVRSDFGMIPTGDFNLDGVVNLADYVVWRDQLGTTVVPAGSGIDIDGSGVVDQGDYDLWKMNLGAVNASLTAGGPSLARVPEPQTLTLAALAASLAGVVWACPSVTKRPKNAGRIEKSQKKVFTGETA